MTEANAQSREFDRGGLSHDVDESGSVGVGRTGADDEAIKLIERKR